MEKSSPQNIQDAFLNTARREKQDVVFQLSDGNSISGRIKSFDKFSVLLDIDGNDILLFKHAITTVSVEKKKPNFG
jgi:host factor-I protein